MTPVDALDTMILMGLNAEASARANISPEIFRSTKTLMCRTSRSQFGCWGVCCPVINYRDKRLLDLAEDLGTGSCRLESPTACLIARESKDGKGQSNLTNRLKLETLLIEFGTLSS